MFRKRQSRTLLVMTLAVVPALLSLTSAASLAQSSSPALRPRREQDPNEYYRGASTMTGKTVVVPIGATWEGHIDQTISSTRSHTGQRFNIIMANPVLLNGTDVIIPAGSEIMGEVVEAIPASRVPHGKFEDKRFVRGKLRVALSSLRTPDGVTYPLVASLAGENPINKYGGNPYSTPLGTSVGYVGTDAQFAAFDPSRGRTPASRMGQNKVVSKRELLADSIMGAGEDGYRRDKATVRSLLLKGKDYWIYEGSPLTVRLEAPFRIGIATPGMGAPISPVSDAPVEERLPPPSRHATSGGDRGFGEDAKATPMGGGGPSPAAPQGQGTIPADSF